VRREEHARRGGGVTHESTAVAHATKAACASAQSPSSSRCDTFELRSERGHSALEQRHEVGIGPPFDVKRERPGQGASHYSGAVPVHL
jgi:hypothetical protein